MTPDTLAAAWTDLSQHFITPCFTSLISPKTRMEPMYIEDKQSLRWHLGYGQRPKGQSGFQPSQIKQASIPPASPSLPLTTSPCLFAKWKRRVVPSLSINLKRPDDQWHTSHSIFLLNWANKLICFGYSGMQGG